MIQRSTVHYNSSPDTFDLVIGNFYFEQSWKRPTKRGSDITSACYEQGPMYAITLYSAVHSLCMQSLST